MSDVLRGLVVVDFSTSHSGLQAAQVFADNGAEVIGVEPPGGHPLRAQPNWPFLARGRKSIVLNLKDSADRIAAQNLIAGADVVFETFRPGVADRLGIGYDEMSERNPRLVYCSLTGFGTTGPYARVKGYESVVLAKYGVFDSLSALSRREGPSFASASFAGYPAAQLLAQGALAALIEREHSGQGQLVETSLAQGLSVHDTFNWHSRVLGRKFGDAFKQVPLSIDGIPTGGLSFRLLIALTNDGRWMQFSQTVQRLFEAMMRALDLDWMFSDEKFKSAPDFDDVPTRVEYWEHLLTAVRAKTTEEWADVFDADPDVWAEKFSKGPEVLDHPQIVWNQQVAVVEDQEVGAVRQPGVLAQIRGANNAPGVSAPLLDQDAAELRERTISKVLQGERVETDGRPPLDGVTVLELGTYYAAPFGATLMAEYGARVIKIEELSGDPMRNMLPFPEIAGIKAVQGKESFGVDIHTEAGRQLLLELVAKADVVLQSFRAGVADRLKVDAASLKAVNPNLIYVEAPGYGTGGPNGHRPAFAPTIGAAAGLAWRNAGAMIPDGPDLTLQEVKDAAVPMALAVMGVGNCDGFASVGVATAMMLGLLARERTGESHELLTTMIGSATHALSEAVVTYDGAPQPPTADKEVYGFSATYRLYQAAEGWVFVAAPSDEEFSDLAKILDPSGTLRSDNRFSTAAERETNGQELASRLAELFLSRTASEWERELLAVDVACVEVTSGPVEANFLDEDRAGRASGFVTMTWHSILDEHERLTPLVTMSRSGSVAGGGCMVGQHTDTIMSELGHSDQAIADLRLAGVIGG